MNAALTEESLRTTAERIVFLVLSKKRFIHGHELRACPTVLLGMVDQGWQVLKSDSFADDVHKEIAISMHYCGNDYRQGIGFGDDVIFCSFNSICLPKTVTVWQLFPSLLIQLVGFRKWHLAWLDSHR